MSYRVSKEPKRPRIISCRCIHGVPTGPNCSRASMRLCSSSTTHYLPNAIVNDKCPPHSVPDEAGVCITVGVDQRDFPLSRWEDPRILRPA
jgi:hypothetical protein